MPIAYLYFDDYCYLCSNTIRFLALLDRQKKFKFYGLNSKEKPTIIKKSSPDILSLDSIILYHDDQFYIKSKAVFQVFKILGGGFNLLMIFKFIPFKIWDKIYDFIAQHRYKLFGKRKSCYLPKN